MKLKNYNFKFKQFTVKHELSSMHIGADAVLLGSWAAKCLNPRKILDVGCGCGVIALMCAQRFINAEITAIDIDSNSVQESDFNFSRSPWHNRLSAHQCDFCTYDFSGCYDLIISNPPYFSSGVQESDSSRITARHEIGFGPISLISRANTLLDSDGILAMIIPFDRENEIIDFAKLNGLVATKICRVMGNANKAAKRSIIEFAKTSEYRRVVIEMQNLAIFKDGTKNTPEYDALLRDFLIYL